MSCVIDYAGLRTTAESTFLDTCRIGTTPTAASDMWNLANTVPADPLYADAISCGFKPTNAGEVRDGSQAPLHDATLRLPVDTDIKTVDYIELTHRHGTALDPLEYYAVIGKPELGPSALVLRLKFITGNSAL